jgi:hypothetical protein
VRAAADVRERRTTSGPPTRRFLLVARPVVWRQAPCPVANHGMGELLAGSKKGKVRR